MKWPASTEKTAWKRSDQMVGKADNKLHVISGIIYNFSKEKFEKNWERRKACQGTQEDSKDCQDKGRSQTTDSNFKERRKWRRRKSLGKV
jgi:hypothetical protein